MAIAAGTRFGPYEIVGEIGAGGMGVVFRATDTKLKRDVAVKVLPSSLAADEERLLRFRREAELLASLNHPNIAQIHGLEDVDGAMALVMELVEGPTLEDRIKQGVLSPDNALGIAMQIAEGLEAAHGRGIVHRDLKPANIKLRPDGIVKILDFGIAKALEPESLTSEPASPMLTTPATQVGVILGTAAYMSPEQARGKQVDQRADIWAFGCVLFEMLTGQPAFGGEDVPITLARILTNDADTGSLPGAISLAVRQTIELCLRKDLKKRVADIRDVRLALEGAFETVAPAPTGSTVIARPLWRRALPAVATALVAMLATGAAVWSVTRPAPPTVTRFVHALGAGQSLRNPSWPFLAISRDGQRFVYDTGDGLVLRSLNTLETRLIAGTERALDNVAFSPDGQSLAYWSAPGNDLRRISIEGGTAVRITETPDGVWGMSWLDDGALLYMGTEGIKRVSASGGPVDLLIPVPAEVERVWGARMLPDGDTVLFGIYDSRDYDTGRIVAESLSTGERTVLIEGGADARYLPSGHLVYALGDVLLAVRFDPDTLTVSGAAVPLVTGVMRSTIGSTPVAHYDVSDNGTLIYASGSLPPVSRALVWVDRNGNVEAVDAPARAYTSPRISPDGSQLLFNARDEELDIWTFDFDSRAARRLTFDPGRNRTPLWFPDGTRIAYDTDNEEGGSILTSRAADGSDTPERLAVGGQLFASSFVADPAAILVTGNVFGNGNDDIAMVPLDGSGTIEPVLQSDLDERHPDLSPDGHWMAYSSNESGEFEVYVRPFPDVYSGGPWQISRGGGDQPLWSRDGTELFYRNGDAMMRVAVDTQPTLSNGNAEQLFAGDYANPEGGRTFDYSAERDRFLMLRDVEVSSTKPYFVVVENWFEELERLAPTK